MKRLTQKPKTDYDDLLVEIVDVIQSARRAAARSVNSVMTTTYWFVGHRIVEHEQQGTARAAYGERLLKHLARDLSGRFGRGFSKRNLEQMRAFYLEWPMREATSSEISAPAGKIRKLPIAQTLSAQFSGISSDAVLHRFPLPWSHYARLLAVKNADARAFYEHEAASSSASSRKFLGATEMKKNILGPMLEGFRDALRLYLALAIAPFNALSVFVRHDNTHKPSRDRARAH